MSSNANDFVLDFTALISWLTVYYFVERLLRKLVSTHNPPFYEKLRASRKDRVFFGIAMGMVITVVSTPSCAHAALDAWKTSQLQQQEPWHFGSHAKVCMRSRGVLWVSELNRLDLYELYVLHHAGSILALLSWLHFRWPSILFFILFTTLVSEIPGDLLFMVSAYRETMEKTSLKLDRFRRYLMWFNLVQYSFVRGTGILTVAWMTWFNKPGLLNRSASEQLYAYSLLGLYLVFCATYVFRQCRSLRRQAYTSTTSRPQTPRKRNSPAGVKNG